MDFCLRHWALYCWLFCGLLIGKASEAAEIPALNVNELTGRVSLVDWMWLLEDTEHRLDPFVVSRGELDDQFQALAPIGANLGMTDGSFWTRLILHNDGQDGKDMVIELPHKFTDFVHFYVKRPSGEIQEIIQGDRIAPSKLSLRHTSPALRFTVEPGVTQVYLMTQTEGSTNLNSYLFHYDDFVSASKDEHMFLCVLVGIFLVMFLYNLFLYASFRSRSYLFYLIYLMFFGGSQLALTGFARFWLSDSLAIVMMNRGFLTSTILSVCFSLLFARGFLNMALHMKVADRITKYMIILLGAISFLLWWMPYGSAARVVNSSTMIATAVMIFFGTRAALSGYRPAVFYTVAWSSLLISSVYVGLAFLGFFEDNLFTRSGSFIGGAIEITLMSLALADRVNFVRNKAEAQILELNTKLQNHLIQVEELVEQRTETISRIVNNVKSGFLTVNRDFEVEEGFTTSCRNLLGIDLQTGQNIVALLCNERRQAEHFELALQQVFDDQLPEEVTLRQIPVTHSFGAKTLSFAGSVVRNREDEVEAILFTITDDTALHDKQREAMLNGMLLKVVSNLNSFRSFITYVQQGVSGLQAKAVDGELGEVAAYGFLHTIKGTCLIFGMFDEAQAVHELEEAKADLEMLEELCFIFQIFVDRHAEILGFDWQNIQHHRYQVSDVELNDLHELVQRHDSEQLKDEVDQWIRFTRSPTVRDIIGPMQEDIQRLSEKLAKPVRFDCQGLDIKIEQKSFTDLLKVSIHLVRNALIHGIEANRDSLGKERMGTIHFRVDCDSGGYRLVVADDGRGIDRSDLVRSLRAWGLEVDEQSELAELLRLRASHHKHRTESADLYAGRGIGLEALFETSELIGARLHVASAPGRGTSFEIILPFSASLSMAS